MPTTSIALLASLMIAAAPAREPVVPEGARVVLSFDKKEYTLGENILVHYRLENAGKVPFSASYGGDYRFASRALRFKVAATDEAGKAVADPDPSASCFGGIGGTTEVKPGGAFVESLPLARYCRFDEPGTYTIRVHHDHGWREGDGRKYPVGTAKIRLIMPTPEQARAVVEEMDRLPKNPEASFGERAKPYADYTALHYLAYIPLLVERAEAGSEGALAGLGSIARPEATRALIRLLDDRDPKVSLGAAKTLVARLPDPRIVGKLAPKGVAENPFVGNRRALMIASWRADFAAAVREHGRAFLGSDDQERVICGASMIDCVGNEEDLPALIAALDRAVTKTALPAPVPEPYPSNRGACADLLQAAKTMVARGVRVPEAPRTPGETALYLCAIAARPGSRPEGWEDRVLAVLDHEISYLHALALINLPENLPTEMAARLVERLPKLLGEADVEVQVQACQVAARLKDPALKAPILRIVATARNSWLLGAANTAAWEDGAAVESLQIIAGRLDEPGMGVMCMQNLIAVVKDGTSYGFNMGLDEDQGRILKPLWKAFLSDQSDRLGPGLGFEMGESTLPAILFPKGFHFYRKDGKTWPPEP